MQGNTITLKEVLETMDRGESFSMSVVTANVNKGEGGELFHVKNARKHNWLSPEDRKKQARLQPASVIIKKHPNHYENSTRNIRLENGEIRKIHIRLIRRFNDQIVL